MNENPKPPDKGGTSNDDCFDSSIMEIDDIGLVIERKLHGRSKSQIPAQQSASVLVSPSSGLPSDTATSSSYANNSLSNKFENRNSARYGFTDSGPFHVFLESKEGNLGRLHPMSIGKLILLHHKEIDQNVIEINSVGRNRVKVIFRTFPAANKFLDSKILLEKGIDAYIPTFLIRRIGVVRNVDLSLTDADIVSMLNSDQSYNVMVLSVKRFTRKVSNNGETPIYKNTGTVMVTFKGQKLPSSVTLCRVKCSVEPYVQRVVQCYNCLRYGHVSKQCKSKIRCNRCGGEHGADSCNSLTTISCIHCKGEHISISHQNCPEFTKQKAIKTLMAHQNISYREAKDRNEHSFSSVVRDDFSLEQNEFPNLSATIRNKRKRITNTEVKYKNNVHNHLLFPHRDTNQNGSCLISEGSISLSQPLGITRTSCVNETVISNLVLEILKIFKVENTNKNLESVIKNTLISSFDKCVSNL